MVSFTHDSAGTSERAWETAGLEGLSALDSRAIPGSGGLLVVVSAHPDDETLASAGLIQHALAADAQVKVLLCTAGEASHPNSPTHTRRELAAIRLKEMAVAMSQLGHAPQLEWEYLGFADGAVAVASHALDEVIAEAVRTEDGSERDVVLAVTYSQDGHTDHEAVGASGRRVAALHGVPLIEFPIWYWHWATPRDPRWREFERLSLSAAEQRNKQAALAQHASQTQPLSSQPGDGALLGKHVTAHFERPFELFRFTPIAERGAKMAQEVFDALYRRDPDPWAYLSSWYEQRKRAVTLASLTREHYANAVEAGCSIGVLTQELATRCAHIVGIDASGEAIALARRSLAGLDSVSLRHAQLPQAWDFADSSLDLVVISEIGYFLTAEELRELLQSAWASLGTDGQLLLCHWLGPIEGWSLNGQTVHDIARIITQTPPIVQHRESAFLLEVFERKT